MTVILPDDLAMSVAPRRDTIVIGASLGGVEALTRLVSTFPEGLEARILVVQHTSEESPGLLGEILDGAGPLSAALAKDGEPLEAGRIYVAPPGRHLLVTAEGVRTVFGPRENRARPAIDPLFRTAAVACRSRVIGLVLTGLLGDGTAGLVAVHRCGGLAIVQDPDDATYPEMPTRALAAVPEATTAKLADLGDLLSRLTRQPAPEPPPVPEVLRIEARLTERSMNAADWQEVPSRSTDYTCPECSGALREIDDQDVHRYRCRVGHAYSEGDLVAAKDDGVEEALWLALQSLQERTQMLETMASENRDRGWNRNSATFEQRARESRNAADKLRGLITQWSRQPS